MKTFDEHKKIAIKNTKLCHMNLKIQIINNKQIKKTKFNTLNYMRYASWIQVKGYKSRK